MMTYILISVLLISILFEFFIYVKTRKSRYIDTSINENDLDNAISSWPNISIFISCKNEEKNVHSSIVNLEEIKYPKNKLSIYIVDDGSTDKTFSEIKWAIKNLKMHNYKAISLVKENKNIPAKAGVINYLYEQTKDEFFLITDAGTEINPLWAKTLTLAMVNPNFFNKFGYSISANCGIISGATTGIKGELFAELQHLEWVNTIATLNLWNNPITAVGNNMIVRRSSFEQVDGYTDSKLVYIEDFFLYKKMRAQKINIGSLIHQNSVIKKRPLNSLFELYKRRKRWVQCSLFLPKTLLIGTTSQTLLLITFFYFLIFNPILLILFFPLFSLRYRVILNWQNKFDGRLSFRNFLYYFFFTITYLGSFVFYLILPFKNEWRGEKI